MKGSPLRELAERHAAGEVSLLEYRRLRRELIDGVVAGRRLPNGQPRRPRRWPLVSTGVVIGAALALVLGLRFAPRHASPHAAAPRAASAAGPALISEFLASHDWQDASLETFLHRWHALPAGERRRARESYLYPRLLSELEQQIAAQRAMQGLSKHPAAGRAHLARLQAMSRALRPDTQP